MGAVPVQQMADRVAQLMEERLHIRGKGLMAKLRHARGVMPRRVQAEAAVLAKYATLAQNPKLMMQLDHDRIAEAYDACIQHLNGVGRWERRKSLTLGIASSIAFRLLVVFGLLVTFLVWKGYV
ncbi:MAG: hypothetical protein GC186_08400 [Rhodobacteraceae bacterium]|nr:hypothetical protein [Paracoccaceae bacterium]